MGPYDAVYCFAALTIPGRRSRLLYDDHMVALFVVQTVIRLVMIGLLFRSFGEEKMETHACL